MKVLFAVNSESISDAIIKKYQKDYREILSYKNVYYFNAILKEIQQDKTYDRIVISEDLEPFSNNNYESIDKFIFEKLDSISDEAHDTQGNEISIILIGSDRHTKGSSFLVKIFGIGVYNALLGNDRSKEEVCRLINRPRTKKEAKMYYRIDTDEVNYKAESENEVSELEIQNIINHFKKLGKNSEKYVSSFDNIASQYTDEQLLIIINCLPMSVKAVLEESSPKYQEIMSVNTTMVKGIKSKTSSNKEDAKRTGVKIDIIENKLTQTKMTQPIVIPNSVKKTKTTTAKKVVEIQQQPNDNAVSLEEKTIPKKVERKVSSEPQKVVKKRAMTEEEILLRKKALREEKLKKLREEKANEIKKVKPVRKGFEDNKVSKVSENETEDIELPDIEFDTPISTQIKSTETKVKKRGRPKKKVDETQVVEKPKNKRGRPKKKVEEENVLDDELVDNLIEDTVEEKTVKKVKSHIEEKDDDFDFSDLDDLDDLPAINENDEEDNDEIFSEESFDEFDEYDEYGKYQTTNNKKTDDDIDQMFNEDILDEQEDNNEEEDDDLDIDLSDLDDLDSNDDLDVEEDDNDESELDFDNDDNELDLDFEEDDDELELEDESDTDDLLSELDDDLLDDLEEDDDQLENNELISDSNEDLIEDEFESNDYQNPSTSNYYENANSFENEPSSLETVKQPIDYSMSTLNSLMAKDKKIVTFIGSPKNGVSFLINSLAEIFASVGINTAILDMTQNKNSYYIYTQNEESLRKIAYSSIENLQRGVAQGIKVKNNLTVYTALPNDRKDYSNAEPILSTLVQNHSLVLIDCDFETDPSYFACCQEIYLVQSLDILTIQPLTAFLKDLKRVGVLEPEKVKVVINKELKVKGLTNKAIIGGMSVYNAPAMDSMTELFNKDNVKYCSIPFEEIAYSKYLESIVNCKVSISKYSKNMQNKLRVLGDMVYPLTARTVYNQSPTQQAYSQSNFSNSMNNTLNKMRKKF